VSAVELNTSVPAVTFTKTGLLVPDDNDVLNGRLADLAGALGGAMSTSLITPQGQIAMSESAIISDKNDQMLAIVNQVNPDFSSGRFQDAIARLYFLDRIGATGTTVTATCTGLVNTLIPAGSIARDKTGYLYVSLSDATISESGSVDVIFQNMTTGPIACAAGELDTVHKSVPGWSGITNSSAGVLGNDEETRENFEFRRRQSVAKNAKNTINAIRAEVLSVAVDAFAMSNNKNETVNFGATDYPLLPSSIFVCVYGGTDSEIADAIWRKAPPGIDFNGDTEYTIYDTDTYSDNPPAYIIKWVTATPVPVFITVTLKSDDNLPSDIESQIRNALIQSFNGNDGGVRARIASTVSAGRFYSGIYKLDDNIDVMSIEIGRETDLLTNRISFGIDEIPTLEESNIKINFG